MIEFDSVTKLYGTVIGVNDVTLHLGAGAYGLLGPNGSGKTTFLNLIMGQLRPTMGRVRVFGANPRDNPAMLRRIGYCPADETLYANVSALEWVTYLTQLQGFAAAAARARAERALSRVGMSHAWGRAMGTYSRGMRQRTKLAQALAHDPEFLILDEPFNGLDPIGRHEIMEMLREWTRGGGSLLLASHILYEVEAISRSFLLICGGRLLASGTAAEVSAMLAEVPSQIRVRCDNPRALAERLVREGCVESVRIDGDQQLVATARHPQRLFAALPQWQHDAALRIRELRSSDESLQNLFESLMRLHRGG